MPVKEGPYAIKGPGEENDFLTRISEQPRDEGCVPLGLVREFQVRLGGRLDPRPAGTGNICAPVSRRSFQNGTVANACCRGLCS